MNNDYRNFFLTRVGVESYIRDRDYIIGGRLIKGGLNVVPYNEMYVKVGGDELSPSYELGIGLPIGLFCRSGSYKDIVSLLRTRARVRAILQITDLPLFLITPENGIKVFTSDLQSIFFKQMATRLNPFQNPRIQHKTTIDSNSAHDLNLKMLELLDLNELRSKLTHEECAR